MKHFLYVLFIVCLSFGCSKEDWQNINLNSNECEDAGAYLGQIDNEVGIIKSDGSGTVYIELPEGVFGSFQQNLIPCNIEVGDLQINTRIKISGAIRLREDLSDNIEINFRFIELSKAQIE